MINKVAIVTDSNSGITQAQAKEMGIHVIPMPFYIDEIEYYEDINLTREEFYEKLTGNCNIHTSQPSPEAVIELWEEILKDYSEIIHIPMSSGLSSSYQTARMLSEDYDGRVEVVNNQRISVTMRQSVLDAIKLSDQGFYAKEIRRKLEDDKYNSSIYISLETLEYLKRGGRLTPAVAMIGQLLKIKPVLQIQGEKLDAFQKVRTMSQAKTVMLNQIEKDIVTRFKGTKTGEGCRIHVAHSNNLEAALQFRHEIAERFTDIAEEDIYVDELSLSVSCHIGPGALAVATTQKSI